MAPPQTLRRTARAYLYALNDADVEAITALIVDDFHASIFPSSARVDETGGRVTREDALQKIIALRKVVAYRSIHILKEWPLNCSCNQVIMLARITTRFRPGAVGDDNEDHCTLVNEMLFIFTMVTTGEKVRYIDQFNDSLAVHSSGKLSETQWRELWHYEA